MPPRELAARWVVQGELKLETATHLGGEETGRMEMAVLRDPVSGAPLLPGTTLAGALRNLLADRLAGYRTKEPREVSHLFGDARDRDEEGEQSPLMVFDSLGRLPREGSVEIRDGVAIDPAWGTAEPHKKFAFEVLPPGTRFPFRLELVITERQGNKEKELLRLLATLLDHLDREGFSLGKRRSRGLGRLEAVAAWRARRFALDSAAGWRAWLATDHEDPLASTQAAYPKALDALRAALPDRARDWDLSPLPDERQRLVLELELEVVGELLVRSPAADHTLPEVVHLRSGEEPVLPGTGVAGVLRAHALRIARLIRGKEAGGKMVEELFGRAPRQEDQSQNQSRGPTASRLWVGEATIQKGLPRYQARIAIDRFTGGVVDGALFEEQPWRGGRLRLRLELREPRPGERGLLLLVVRDLLEGYLPVGGGSAVGRGLLQGRARLHWQGRPLELTPQVPPPPEVEEWIQEFVRLKERETEA